MQVYDHVIEIPTLTRTVTLVPLACLHVDAPGFQPRLLDRAMAILRDTPDSYAIGLGDYFDFPRTAYRRHLIAYQKDKDSRGSMDRTIEARAHDFVERYGGTLKGRLLGLVEGNHHYEFNDGTTDTQALCRLLETRYLGVASWHRLLFRVSNRETRTLTMFLHHGNWGGGGGGRTKGASRNAADSRGTGRWADIIIFAHDHKPDAWIDTWQTTPPRGRPRVEYVDRLFMRAGTFMQGDVEGCTTYVEQGLMRPEKPGFVVAEIQMTRDRDDGEKERPTMRPTYEWRVVTRPMDAE